MDVLPFTGSAAPREDLEAPDPFLPLVADLDTDVSATSSSSLKETALPALEVPLFVVT